MALWGIWKGIDPNLSSSGATENFGKKTKLNSACISCPTYRPIAYSFTFSDIGDRIFLDGARTVGFGAF